MDYGHTYYLPTKKTVIGQHATNTNVKSMLYALWLKYGGDEPERYEGASYFPDSNVVRIVIKKNEAINVFDIPIVIDEEKYYAI